MSDGNVAAAAGNSPNAGHEAAREFKRRLCSQCLAAKTNEDIQRGLANCGSCRERARERYKACRKAGLCASCLCRPAERKARCQQCFEKFRRKQATAVENGKCKKCGKSPAEAPFLSCRHCLDTAAWNNRKSLLRKAAAASEGKGGRDAASDAQKGRRGGALSAMRIDFLLNLEDTTE